MLTKILYLLVKLNLFIMQYQTKQSGLYFLTFLLKEL